LINEEVVMTASLAVIILTVVRFVVPFGLILLIGSFYQGKIAPAD
jgi:hypothetical protein